MADYPVWARRRRRRTTTTAPPAAPTAIADTTTSSSGECDIVVNGDHLPVRIVVWCVAEREIRRDSRCLIDVHLDLGQI